MTGHFDRIFPVDYESGTQNVTRHVFFIIEKRDFFRKRQSVKKRVFGTF